MFHFLVFLINGALFLLSLHKPFLSVNVQITLCIVGFIALLRFLIERDLAYGEKLTLKAKEYESMDKELCKSGIGKCVFRFKEESQVFVGFQDFLIQFDNGKEKILSSSKAEIINKIKNSNGDLVFYYYESFIVDVKDICN